MSVAHPAAPVGRPAGALAAGWPIAALAAALAAYNVALNHVPFPAWSYVPANLALAAGIAVLARWRWGLTAQDLGLTRAGLRPGLLLAAGVVGAAGLVLAAAPSVPWAEPLLADRRAAGVGGLALAYTVLLRIPLGTAVPEEVIFRGVVLAAYRQRTTEARAVLASSVAFGVWHIGPGLAAARVNLPDLTLGGTVLALVAVVGGTTLAGVLFCLLRRWGRGLLAPVVVHAAVNVLSLLAAVRFQS